MTTLQNTTRPILTRPQRLRRLVIGLSLLLFFKILLSIVYQYRFYFPPDFSASFLAGRESTFHGWYRAAFYLHIVVGPIAILLALGLVISGTRAKRMKLHRKAGKLLLVLVVVLLCPSGLIMATESFGGPVAGVGFAMLALLTAASIVMAAYFASRHKIADHQIWATRSFILLCSPFLLRMMTGTTIVTGIDTEQTYQLCAWSSWLAPLAIYELVRLNKAKLQKQIYARTNIGREKC